jgi:DNA-3-methyladenine glycosylase I
MEALEAKRCPWCGTHPTYVDYHDHEWGKPVWDDRLLFEMLNLEGAQAGLSWFTVLQKRDNYKALFSNFDAQQLAGYPDARLEEILLNPGIIRNRLKVYGVRANAQACLKVAAEYGSFSKYIWSFVEGVPQINHWREMREIPPATPVSDRMSKDLKKRGFKFVGSTICYAFMQAVGMVNDHLVSCPHRGHVPPQ